MPLTVNDNRQKDGNKYGRVVDNPVTYHLGYFAISYVNLGHQNNLGDEQPGYQVPYVCAPQVTR
jgi:hypothetical protein